MEVHGLITILGPTAVGKTRVAALLAKAVDGEIISADSRQVYLGMTLGTGKDLEDYNVDGYHVPYHLIDVANPNEEFHVFRFKKLFCDAADDIQKRNKRIILCGGTGLYLDAVLRDYFFAEVPENMKLRKELSEKTTEELGQILLSMKKVHNKTDLEDRDRLLRAIEIQVVHQSAKENELHIKLTGSGVFGIDVPREIVRERISQRLNNRLHEGMINEVESLMKSGITAERLISFGLEYKFVTLHILGKLTKSEMQQKLCTAIQQFAKRQMSWFRRMEKFGVKIEWIDGMLSPEERVGSILNILHERR